MFVKWLLGCHEGIGIDLCSRLHAELKRARGVSTQSKSDSSFVFVGDKSCHEVCFWAPLALPP